MDFKHEILILQDDVEYKILRYFRISLQDWDCTMKRYCFKVHILKYTRRAGFPNAIENT